MIEIVAEIGKNFIDIPEEQTPKELLYKAKLLVLGAKEAGANTAKFQIHVFEDEQKKRSEKRYEWIKRNERGTPYEEFWKPLQEFCKANDMNFLVTGMSKMACEKINDLVDRFKVGSGDVTDLEMLRYIAETKKPVTLSTGMSTMPEVMRALDVLTSHGSKITLTHCISMYPTNEKRLNLNTINFFKKGFPNFKIGFSDHSLSIFVPSLAVAMGCEVIEKHLTLDRDVWGPDHKVSLIPKEFAKMVSEIRRTERILGVEDKLLYNEEKLLWENFRTQ